MKTKQSSVTEFWTVRSPVAQYVTTVTVYPNKDPEKQGIRTLKMFAMSANLAGKNEIKLRTGETVLSCVPSSMGTMEVFADFQKGGKHHKISIGFDTPGTELDEDYWEAVAGAVADDLEVEVC